MDAGVPGVASKTDGRLASAVREKPEKFAFFAEKRLVYATNGLRGALKGLL